MPRKSSPGRSANKSRRRVCYGAAISLDGFIAEPDGQFDWIITDPDRDFGDDFKRFDTLLVGRRTFETMRAAVGDGTVAGTQVYVFSRTLKQKDHPKVKIADNPGKVVAELRDQPGKEIALFGGGSLFRSLVEAKLVDTVDVSVIPVLLGEGIPLMAPPGKRVNLQLTGWRLYPKTGTMRLNYAVQYAQGRRRHRAP